jgi:hypothetical protein
VAPLTVTVYDGPGCFALPGGKRGGVPLNVSVSVPLNEGATPPSQLPAVDQLVAVPVKLFHVNDWAFTVGTQASATPADRANARKMSKSWHEPL